MRLLPLTMKILSREMNFEDRIEQGDFGDFERDIDDDETLDGSELDANNVISV